MKKVAALRPRRSDADLVVALRHIDYEIGMLVESADALLQIEVDEITKNAFIESFATHARCLVSFFYPPSGARANDVLAADFFDPQAAWDVGRPALPKAMSEARDRADKLLAHLTYDREVIDRRWPFPEIVRSLAKLIEHFNRLGPRFRIAGPGAPGTSGAPLCP